MKHTFAVLSLLFALLLVACSALGNGEAVTADPVPTVIADSAIIAEGHLEPMHSAQIAFTASGTISEVLVREGQAVKKGDALIRLGDTSDTNYAAAQLELVSAEKALLDLVNAAGADFAQSVIDLKDAREELDKAEDYLKYLQDSKKVPQTETRFFLVQTWKGYEYRYKTKSFKGPAPEDWIIEAENDLALKKAQFEAVQRRYDTLMDGADSEQLPVLEARLDAARTGVAAFAIRAPFGGVVAELPAELGGRISAGQPALTLADFSEWRVETTDLTEIDVVALAEGQPVLVTLDALPETELTGTILSIGQSYAENQGDIVYQVTILLNETHPAMRWGMTVSVLFEDQD